MLGMAGTKHKISCVNVLAYNGLEDISRIRTLGIGQAVAVKLTLESRNLSVKN